MLAVTEAEWEIMRVLWANGAMTSREIIDILAEAMDWKPATIKTLIGRLREKNAVSAQKNGRQYIYEALISERELLTDAMLSLFDHVCQRDGGKVISLLIDQIPMTKKDLNYLVHQIEEKEKNAPTELPCECLPGQCHCNHHEE